jgi:hypothetical protein
LRAGDRGSARADQLGEQRLLAGKVPVERFEPPASDAIICIVVSVNPCFRNSRSATPASSILRFSPRGILLTIPGLAIPGLEISGLGRVI